MTNGPIAPTTWDTENKIKQVQFDQLNTAITRLEQLKGNVQNCDCAPSNCCQSQVCQACQLCQSCQGCQTTYCQSNCVCQSCQGCQACQACEACQSCNATNCS